jgi:amino acid transporter
MKDSPDRPPAALGLWDVVSIIVGIVVGTGIYRTPPDIFNFVSGPAQALIVWAACGLLACIGALCYAELATAYPRTGGDYVYLGRAFGPWLGFLFGWAQLAVLLTGSIGMMAYVFADYAIALGPVDLFGVPIHVSAEHGVYAALGAVGGLTLLNLLGLAFGKWTQNLLTLAKVVGLGGILVAGFGWPNPPTISAPAAPAGNTMLGLAMVLVLYTYGGWNDAAFVAAEMRDAQRNIPRALLLGTGLVTVIYVLVNAAYLRSLGFDGARQSKAIAADVLAGPLGARGRQAMCLLVMISALGAANGLILAGARVYASLGTDHRLFAWLGRRWGRRHTPAGAMLAQALISVALIAAVGIPWCREQLTGFLQRLGVGESQWEGTGGFDTLIKWTAPTFWLLFLLTGLSVFVLRERDGISSRPFRVPLYPYLPLIFCCTCAYMLYSAINYAGAFSLVGAGLLLIGLPLYEISRRLGPAGGAAGTSRV